MSFSHKALVGQEICEFVNSNQGSKRVYLKVARKHSVRKIPTSVVGKVDSVPADTDEDRKFNESSWEAAIEFIKESFPHSKYSLIQVASLILVELTPEQVQQVCAEEELFVEVFFSTNKVYPS